MLKNFLNDFLIPFVPELSEVYMLLYLLGSPASAALAFYHIKPTGEFPSTNASLYVDGNALSADAIAGVEKSFTWADNELLTSKDKDGNNAGTVYFTLNPSNIKPKALKSLTLVNNLQDEIFELGEATPCEEVMNWGITRADGEKAVTHDAVMYQAPAKYDVESVKAIELKNIIDYKAIGKNVKNIINDAKAAANDVNRSNYSEVASPSSKISSWRLLTSVRLFRAFGLMLDGFRVK